MPMADRSDRVCLMWTLVVTELVSNLFSQLFPTVPAVEQGILWLKVPIEPACLRMNPNK